MGRGRPPKASATLVESIVWLLRDILPKKGLNCSKRELDNLLAYISELPGMPKLSVSGLKKKTQREKKRGQRYEETKSPKRV